MASGDYFYVSGFRVVLLLGAEHWGPVGRHRALNRLNTNLACRTRTAKHEVGFAALNRNHK